MLGAEAKDKRLTTSSTTEVVSAAQVISKIE